MNLETAMSLNGKDASTISADTVRQVLKNGRKLGISVAIVNSAPKSELAAANSKEHYNQIMDCYPSFISVLKTDSDSEG